MSSPHANTEEPPEPSAEAPPQIHLTIPPRFYLLPGSAIIVGTTIGLMRGSRRESLRFLAENAHRPPTTVRGWYLYNKTKNYRVMMGGLKQAGADAARLAAVAAAWVALEEGAGYVGGVCEQAKEVVAGVGTAGVFSLLYGLPRRHAGRMAVAGLIVGGAMQGLQWSQERLRERAGTAKARVAAESGVEGGEAGGDARGGKA